jgi:hypothetical protein
MNNMNIVFYSQNCDTCKNLLVLLKNENLLSYFALICVDDKLDKLPPQITRVPTIVVSGINKPLIAQEAFEWVKQVKFIRQQKIMDINKATIIQKTLANNAPLKPTKRGPLEFIEGEMTGLSDKFAYTKIDDPIPHAYFGINDEEKNAIFTAPKDQNKLTKDDQAKRIKDLEIKRDQQDNEYIGFMKQQQNEAVLVAEQNKLMQNQNVDLQKMQMQQMQMQQIQQMQQLQMMQQMKNGHK